jgi:hypothetical protein
MSILDRFRIKRAFDHAYQVMIRSLCQKSLPSLLSFIIRSDDPMLVSRKKMLSTARLTMFSKPAAQLNTMPPIIHDSVDDRQQLSLQSQSSKGVRLVEKCEDESASTSNKKKKKKKTSKQSADEFEDSESGKTQSSNGNKRNRVAEEEEGEEEEEECEEEPVKASRDRKRRREGQGK